MADELLQQIEDLKKRLDNLKNPKGDEKKPKGDDKKKKKVDSSAENKLEERAVNPMTMIPSNVAISGKMPLPPKAEQIKKLYGF
jgi:hypothetical protein